MSEYSAGLDPKTAIRKAEQFLHDSDFGAASDFFQENSGVIFQVVDGIVKSLKAVLVAIIRLVRHALRTVVFFGALMFLVSCESDPIDTIFRVIPVVSRKQTELSDRIKHNISQILIVSILLCAWRGFVTWVYFVVLDLVGEGSLVAIDWNNLTQYLAIPLLCGIPQCPHCCVPYLSLGHLRSGSIDYLFQIGSLLALLCCWHSDC